MSRTYVIIQARMTSSRLPGKTLMPLGGKPMLQHVIERCGQMQGIDGICVASPVGDEQNPIKEFVATMDGVEFTQGDEHNVLQRTLDAAREIGADTLIRVTSDCPFFDPDVGTTLLQAYKSSGASYARLAIEDGFPLGFDLEVFPTELLQIAVDEGADEYEKEHATPFIWRRPERFPAIWMGHKPDHRDWRLVVDEPKDYEMAQTAFEELNKINPNFRYKDLVELFARRPDILAINSDVKQTPYVPLDNIASDWSKDQADANRKNI